MRNRALRSLTKVLNAKPSVSSGTYTPTADSTSSMLAGLDKQPVSFTLPEIMSVCIDTQGEAKRQEELQSFIQSSFTSHYNEGVVSVLLGHQEVTSAAGKLYVKHLEKNKWDYLVRGEPIPSSMLTSSLSEYVTYPDRKMKYGHNGDFVRTAYHKTLHDVGNAIEQGKFPSLSSDDLKQELGPELEGNLSNLVDNIPLSNVIPEVREATRLCAWTHMPEPLEKELRVRNAKYYEGREEGADKDFLIRKNLVKVLADEYIEDTYSPEVWKAMDKITQKQISKDVSEIISAQMKEGMEYSDVQLGKALDRVHGRGLVSTSATHDADYGVRPIQPSALVVVPDEKPTEKQSTTKAKDDLRDLLLSSDLNDDKANKSSEDELDDEPSHRPAL
jgi:hypothetical protein